MLATALGAVTLLIAYPALFMIIKYAGAVYYVYIGYSVLTGAIKRWRDSDSPINSQVQNNNHVSGKKAFNKASTNLGQVRISYWIYISSTSPHCN